MWGFIESGNKFMLSALFSGIVIIALYDWLVSSRIF